MPDTAEDLASRALVLVGSAPISSFDDEGDEATAADHIYQFKLDALLGRYRWRFATGQEQLSRLGAAPGHRWDAAYQLPANILILNGVFVNDIAIDFDRYENAVYCDATSSDVVYADFTFKPAISRFPPYFKETLVYEVAAGLATAIAGDPQMAKGLLEQAKEAFVFAKNQDAQGRTARKIQTSRFIALRGGVRR